MFQIVKVALLLSLELWFETSWRANAAAYKNHLEECLVNVRTTSSTLGGAFRWPDHTLAGGGARGTCRAARGSFGLCQHASYPRDCLLARIPWQTSIPVVGCCFHCCLKYWEETLGLVDIFRYWFDNPTFRDSSFHYRLDRKSAPPLGSVVLHFNSVKRFSLFMYETDVSTGSLKGRSIVHNATHLVKGNAGGGVVNLHGPANQTGVDCEFPFGGSVLEYVRSHPISVLSISDAPCPRSARLFDVHLEGLSHGGRLFTTNLQLRDIVHEERVMTAEPNIVPIPLGVSSTNFETLLFKYPTIGHERMARLMCCCMSSRAGRHQRVQGLESANPGLCSDRIQDYVNESEYVKRLRSSRFVLSMTGLGRSCHRDAEVLAAGAVPVLDGAWSGGPRLFDEYFPAVHANVCGAEHAPQYCNSSEMTKHWFDDQYKSLNSKRSKLSVSKVFWPFWLYHVFLQVPERVSNADPLAVAG